MRQRGVITVYLALMLSVIASFIVFLSSSVQGMVSKSGSVSAADLAVRSCFAEYNRELFRRFHILLVDSSYKTMENGPVKVAGHFFSYLESSISGAELTGADVAMSKNAADDDCEYLYESAVRYAKEKMEPDPRLSTGGDDALFLTYILNVCGNHDHPAEVSQRTGEIEYLLYGFDSDLENIRLALSDREGRDDTDYEDYLAERLEEEGMLLLRHRFGDLVTEYMRANGSPGFDLTKSYYSLTFVADLKNRTFGEYSITREYSYDHAQM